MKLVFIHGRGQEGRDPDLVKRTWLAALDEGFTAAGVSIDIGEAEVLLPYYGDVLADVTGSTTDDEAAPIEQPDDPADHLPCLVVADCLDAAGVRQKPPGVETDDRSSVSTMLSWEWIQTGLSLLDRFVPGASARSLAWAAQDVAMYLGDDEVRRRINGEVAGAFGAIPAREDVVVVAHSLGSVVAYDLLRPGGEIQRPVRAMITIGSPLGIRAIRSALAPIEDPPSVERWFNAYDERDVIALYPLDAENFAFEPLIENFTAVTNDTPNHHGVAGYLSDATIAATIADAVATRRGLGAGIARWVRNMSRWGSRRRG